MADNTVLPNSSGTVTFDASSPAPQTENPSMVPSPIPPQPSDQRGNMPMEPSTSQPQEQYVPQVYTVGDGNGTSKRAPGGSGIGKIFGIFFVLILMGVLGGAGWYAYSTFVKPMTTESTLVYWGLWENEAIVRPIFDEYETSHPGVKIEYVKQSASQYRERLQAAIERGEGPDVFRFHNTWVPMLINQLAAAPTDVVTTQEFAAAFYPTAVSDLVSGSTIYGLPMMYDGLGLYISEDLFTAAAVSPPTTWEDIVKPGGLVQQLTVKDGNTITTSAIALGTATNVENFSDIIATMVMQNGGDLTSPTNDKTQEAFLFYRKFADPGDPLYTWNATLDNSVYAFATGKTAMIFAPSWRAFDIKQINPNRKFKIVPIPQLPGNTVTWASYWVEGVSAKSANQKAAWELVQYMASKDTVVRMYTAASKTRLFGEPYARIELAGTVAGDPYVEAYLTQAPSAKSFPLASRTHDNGLNDKLIKYMEDAVTSMTNGASSGDALNTMSAGFRQVFNQYNLTTSTAP